MKKKLIALLMTAVLAVSMAACGAKESENELDPELKELQDELKKELEDDAEGEEANAAQGGQKDSTAIGGELDSPEVRALIDSINADTAELTGKCGDDLDWYYLDGTLVVKGSGAMWDYDSKSFDETNESLWKLVIPKVKCFIADDGVTSIGTSMLCHLDYFQSKSLSEVLLADSVGTVDAAFYDYHGKSPFYERIEKEQPVIIGRVLYDWKEAEGSVTIPDGIIGIRSGAFRGSGVTQLTIPESVTYIGKGAFEDTIFLVQALAKNERPDHLLVINNILVDGSQAEGDVVIPDGVKRIPRHIFGGNKNITSVTIPEGVTDIEQWAFSGCQNLTSVTIPEGVTDIGLGAFSGCYELTSVTFPDSLIHIEQQAFEGCGLDRVELPSGVELGWYAFSDGVEITYR